jgi:hypothetical protein
MELVRQIFIENTELQVTSITANDDDTYTITTDTAIFHAEAVWGPLSSYKPNILFTSDQAFFWKSNKQLSARVEIDPELLK